MPGVLRPGMRRCRWCLSRGCACDGMIARCDGSVTATVDAVAAVVVAAVWLHQGLWCKVLARALAHDAIVATVPGVGAVHARCVTAAIGVAETVVAAAVVGGRAGRRLAIAQTALLIAMNAGGLLFARDRIAHVPWMFARNAAFVAAIWLSVRDPR